MKVFVTSDIHVGDFLEYNPTPFFRLNQFLKLADFIVDKAKANDIKELWIAGDLLQVARPTPKVMNTLKTFLEKITSNGIVVRAILGNHDVTVRTHETDVSQYPDYSLITLLNIPNLYFYLDEVVNVSNISVHFRSWTPDNAFETRNADVLIAHGDANKKLSNFSSKLIDYSGYKKAFIGHIHKYFETDNFISPNVPIAHSYSDDPDTSITIFDTVTFKTERILTAEHFLKFEYVQTIEDKDTLERQNISENVDAVVRVKKTPEIQKVSNIQSLDIYKHLEGYLDKFSGASKEFIQKVLASVNVENTQNINLDFTLKTLKAKNFLSIKNIDFNFQEHNSLTVIEGAVGAGKSTLFKLIMFMFFGKVQGVVKSDLKSIFAGKKDEFEGDLTLEYNSNLYTIKRTLNKLELYENGQILESENVKERQKVLESKLAFLEFWNILYVSQMSNGIFASMNDGSRVSFLSKFLNLDAVEKMNVSLAKQIDALSVLYTKQEKDIAGYESKLNVLNTFIENHKDLKHLEYSELSDELSTLNADINSLNTQVSEYDKAKTRFKLISSEITRVTNEIDETENSLKELENTLKSDEQLLAEIEVPSDTDDLKNKLVLVQNKLQTLLKHSDECPTCHQKWIIPNLDEMLTKLKSAENVLKTKIESNLVILRKHANLENTIKTTKNKIEFSNNTINKLNNQKTSLKATLILPKFNEKDISALKSQLNDLNVKKEKLLQKIGAIKEKNSLYDELQNNISEKNNILDILSNLRKNYIKTKEICQDAETFKNKVLSNKGLLVAALLKEVSDKINTDEKIQVQTLDVLQNGSVIPTLNLKLYVPQYDKYINYDMLSGGQRLIADIRFLACVMSLTGKIGTLFLDEIFKYLSDTAIIELSEMLKELNVPTIFLTLHGNMQQNISNNIIHVELTNAGSVYTKM
jgi:DNA repair exonuclease SbcCD ATPase subunit/DNA repair exonuclease SbcCD nuclease subunit